MAFAANSNADTASSTEQVSEANDISLLNSQEISDPRVKIIDFEGRPTPVIVKEKTNVVKVTDFYAGNLHIIDGNTDEVIESIKVIKTPLGSGL